MAPIIPSSIILIGALTVISVGVLFIGISAILVAQLYKHRES